MLIKIPDIDPNKVELYGKNFLKLISSTENHYNAVMQCDEDRPQDPNHQNVIDISSDDDEDYGSSDELHDDGSQEERSGYFPVNPDVERFNARSMPFTSMYGAKPADL